MDFKTGLVVLTFLAVSLALPTQHKDPFGDMSVFFDHTDTNARIVGGFPAPERSHPHMVALTHGVSVRNFLCGGSLITRRTILTAAHCVNAAFSGGALQRHLRATVGTNRWNSGGRHFNIARNITHPNYVVPTIRNDISLLITASNVATSTTVRFVTISYAFVGANVPTRVAGWGRTNAGAPLSPNLLEITVNTIDGNDCVRRAAQAAGGNIHTPRVEPHIEICTFHAPGRGTCNGDSGSPLLRNDNRQQIGIVSWGFPCARGAPDMYVRVSAFQSWITRNTVR